MRYNLDDLMALNMAGVGYIRFKELMERFGSPEKILTAKGIKTRERIKKEWSLIKKHKAGVISIFDEGYPENLKTIHSPPIILYVKGKIIPEDKFSVALVGSRRATIYGLEVCKRLAGGLASMGIVIVSGLARGIDSAAHRGALEASGRTIAVLGSGLNVIYPAENKRLADEIISSGALLSEFPMDMAPLKQNFPIRNRVISGLSLGAVIVEAAKQSGALITASFALEQGREVFAVPGKAGASASMGTHGLIKRGAKLVDSVEDIIEELNLELKEINKDAKPQMKLDGAKKKIYDILSDEPVHIDNIIQRINLPPHEVSRLLLELELEKFIKELPGKNFVK